MAAIPTNYVAPTEYLAGHLRAEQGALDAYQRMIDGRPVDDAVTYLIAAILRDEAG